jgi:hypothetical protein
MYLRILGIFLEQVEGCQRRAFVVGRAIGFIVGHLQ